jgi:acetyltransferase-like isoleucine patch superfamily enzyme
VSGSPAGRRFAGRTRDLGYLHGPRLMSFLRKALVRLRHRHATIAFGRGTFLGPGSNVRIPDHATLILGDGVELRRDVTLEVGEGGKLMIGPGTRLTYGVVIQCGTTIEIGSECVFAHGVTIVDGSHRFRGPEPVLDQGYDFRPLSIGDAAAVMASATVIASLGTHAFVGANAVVTRDVPAYSLAVGVPARVVEYFGPEPGAGADPPSSSSTIGETAPSLPGSLSASAQASRKSGASS